MANVYVAGSLCEYKPYTYGGKIGKGLIASVELEAHSLVGEFIGDIITSMEYSRREIAGRGGFGIYLRAGVILDCYKYHKDGICKMSYANTARHTYTFRGGACPDGYDHICGKWILNRNNCVARVDGDSVKLWVGRKAIEADVELFWAYGGGYKILM